MKGVAYNVRWILELIEDVTGAEIQVVKWPQHARALGAALTAVVGLKIYEKVEDLDSLLPITNEAKPNEEHRETYERIVC